MAKFHFSSEVFDIHDLRISIEQNPVPEGITISVTKEDFTQEGERPSYPEILEILTGSSVQDAILRGIITVAVKEAYDQLKSIVFSEPHIIVRFSHGGKRIISYDKNPSDIAQELIEVVTKGGVIKIEFRS